MKKIEKDTIGALVAAYDTFASYMQDKANTNINIHDIDAITCDELRHFVMEQIIRIVPYKEIHKVTEIEDILCSKTIPTNRKQEYVVATLEIGMKPAIEAEKQV